MPSALHGGTTYNCDELAAWALTVQRGQRTVLQRTGLRLEAGEVVCLLGANGAGKTTFLTALAGELKLDRRLHDKQAILMNGTELTSLRTTQQAQSRAVLPQKPGLSFDLQVMEVVAMGAYPFPELSNAQVHDLSSKALAKAELEDLAQRRYLALSGGEQQRVQFARVLVQVLAQRSQDPRGRYLLLDEPTASLDPLHQQRLLQTVRELAQTERIGVLLILHDINLAASWSDRVALLAEGKILACGPPASVLTQKHLYTVYGVEAHIMPHPTRAGRPLIVL
ncbi:heme ABC transporter ATP-binding protein [Paenalcaligenes niemegkensis]|uniref:heme ABC transporter ATP-binding protein n=1 Tax=Paenalcaligenes niemegkensis TaxID=2895469 RepID=UPI0035696E49